MLELLESLRGWSLPMGLSLIRMMIIFWILPFLTESIMQGTMRSIFAFTVTIMVFPLVKESIPPDRIPIMIALGIIIKEVFIGVVLGFIISLPFWAMAAMGFMIDTQRGAFVASLFSPFFGARVSPIGTLLLQALAVLFFVSGGFMIMLKGIYQSYIFWPVVDFYPNMNKEVAMQYFASQFQWHVYLAVLLAAPLTIILFAIDFSMGLVNRFVPQLNVFFLSLPIKGVVAIFLLIVYMVSLTNVFDDHFKGLVEIIGNIETVLK